ncbi:nodulation protein S (NodS) [Palleronia aestuarii]|uniref:Nodulation protein S (NodS) n=1 Tax=Palleronia aestuarii TaxID=568105 RepID=A0A2W7NEE9_9RHOB|nr:SAM-dependent methyltransferase [Palleronia aestuarii]PZX16497.1 nodulation protein S (NodS) [Palleronia aestuarii]
MSGHSPADLGHLLNLYDATDDPWNFRTSAFELGRLDAVARALPRPRYESALELGCGNGELARRIASRCAAYTGLDAVPTALAAARLAVPEACFVEGFLPCDLPGENHDLVLLSEILYFLDRDAIRDLAACIDRTSPQADVVTVTWGGPTGHALTGAEAVAAFADATPRARRQIETGALYRIEIFTPLEQAAR